MSAPAPVQRGRQAGVVGVAVGEQHRADVTQGAVDAGQVVLQLTCPLIDNVLSIR